MNGMAFKVVVIHSYMHSCMLSTSIYVWMNECMHEPTLFLKLQNPLLNEFLTAALSYPTPTPGVP